MQVPPFSLQDQSGNLFSNDDLSGKWSLVYFYPKDGTPLCMKEARNFRDAQAELKQAGLQIVGISADTPESHADFTKIHNLNFTLLSDTESNIIAAFGSVDENEYLGVSRDSYLINPEGEIVKKYTKINPDIHYQEILTDFQNLKSRQ